MGRPLSWRCLSRKIGHSRHIHTPRSIASLLDQTSSLEGEIAVNGFIRSIRNQKQRSFASIGDGSSLESLQALLMPQQTNGLTNGTAVRLTGSWTPSPNPKAQSHELHVSKVEIIGPSDPATYPLQKKYQTPEYLRTMPHMRTRLASNSTLLRLRSDAIAAVTSHLSQMGFTQIHTPIITSSDCEGAGEVFKVETSNTEDKDEQFFKSPKYLTVSSQLHLEALAQSVGNVWTLSPTFRAEKSDTSRHLSEFYMLEVELSFVDDMGHVMDVVEEILCAIGGSMQHSRVGSELRQGAAGEVEIRRRLGGLAQKERFPRITYTEAIKLLGASTHPFDHKPTWGLGLQAEHERYIAKELGSREDCILPVFVTHYPKAIKPFYMLPTSTDADVVDCFDLLVPDSCEIVGGSMREHRLDHLLKSMISHGLIPKDITSDEDIGALQWYLDLRRWGSVPHGGFGIGFDRLLAYLAGVPNIREMVTFPRWVGRCDC